MKKKYKDAAEKQRAYLQRKREKEEIVADAAAETAKIKELNLCSFAEAAFETPAQTCQEEIQIHRSWLRALGQPDVLPGETLRQLARRTWDALLNSEGLGVITDGDGKWADTPNGKQWVRGSGVWYPLFSPSQQHFQVSFDSKRFPGGPLGEGIRDAAKPEWFDAHWVPPGDCSGDEPIDPESLKPLPPMQKLREPEPKPTNVGREH